jgi:transcriptional regulator with XRE-family HTH domain
MNPFEHESALIDVLQDSILNNVPHGVSIRRIRKEVLKLSQDRYATLAGISRRTLSDIERDKESVTLTMLNRAFKPLGLKLGLLPRQTHMLQALLTQLTQHGESHDHS